jgi:uncharacterized protein involved in cysteine biosynthesis
MINDLLFGLTLPVRSASVIARHKTLCLASLGPWLLSLALDIWVVHRMQQGLGGWIRGQLSGTFEWIAIALSWVALIIVGALAFTFIAGIVALPFNDWLAEMTETRATPPLEPVQGLTWRFRARCLAIDLGKTVCALGLSAIALVFSWVPVLNLLGAALTFLLISFQFVSYPQTRRGQGMKEGARFVGRNLWACLGFGASFALLFAIPLVSSLALPLAVVGGTLLYARASARVPAIPAH